jgi:peroxiredoxin
LQRAARLFVNLAGGFDGPEGVDEMKYFAWNRSRLLAAASALAICLTTVAGARAKEVELPQNPAQWINAQPITLDMLKGKAVVLYFFEEDCPTCRGKWPGHLEAAASFKGKPVFFIGVNSGNSRKSVESYVRSVKCDWPVIVDSDRQFEKNCGVPEVNLKNIYQAKIISAKGQLESGNAGDLKAAGEKALNGAEWTVDPTDIPASLQVAWRQVEFGAYRSAAAAIKKARGSRDEAEKAAGEKLYGAVEGKIKALVDPAEKALAEDDKWEAYKLFTSAGELFQGYDLATDAMKQARMLAADDGVKKEIGGRKALDKAKDRMASPSASTQRRAVVDLKQIVKLFEGTQAAAEAESILASVESATN